MKNLLSNITDVVQSDSIRGGALDTIIPDLETLKECIEINPWHDHQSVFDHTTASIAAFEQFLDEVSFSKTQHEVQLAAYLSTHVYGISHTDLIRLALLFHDIAKPLTIVRDAQTGITMCPHHELQGAMLTIELAGTFGIPQGTIRTVSQLVLLHGTVHDVVNAAILTGTGAIASSFQKIVADLYIPLLLLSRCDAQGSDLPVINSDHWIQRRNTIDDAIRTFSLSLK